MTSKCLDDLVQDQQAYDAVKDARQKVRKYLEDKEKTAARVVDSEANVKGVTDYKRTLMTRNHDELIDASPTYYNLLDKQRSALKSQLGKMADDYQFEVTLDLNKMEAARAHAYGLEDFDMVARLDKQIDRINTSSPNETDGSRGWDKDSILQDLGQRARRYTGEAGRILSRLVTTTQSLKSGNAVESGADFYKEAFKQSYSSEFGRISQSGYNDFLEEVNKNNVFRRFYAKGSEGYRQYSSNVVEYMHDVENGLPPRRTYPDSVMKAGDELASMVGEMRTQIQRNGWDVPDVLDNTLNTLSRSADDDALKAAHKVFEKDDIYKVYEGALLTADPTMNIKFNIRRLEALDNPKNAAKIKALKDEVKRVKADPVLQRKIVDDTLASDGARYSKGFSKKMANQQYERAIGIDNPTSKSLNDQSGADVLSVLSDKRPEILGKLTDEEKAILDSDLNYSKKANGGNTDVFARRLKIDSTFNLQLTNDTGNNYTVGMIDFYSDDLDSIMSNTVNQYSSAAGLAKKGIKNFDDFDNELKEAIKAAADLPSNLQKQALADIEMIRKEFKGIAQFGDEGQHNQVKRIIKKFAAGSKLGYLALTLPVELSAVITRQGLMPTMRYMPQVLASLKEIGTMNPAQEGFVRQLALAGTESMNPFYNYIGRADTGFSMSPNKKVAKFGVDINELNSPGDRILNTAENIAGTVAHSFLSVSKPMDMMIRRLSIASTMDNLLNISAKDLKNQRYIDVGVDQAFLDKLQVVRGYIKMEGKTIVDFDYRGLRAADPELTDDFINKVIRIADRQVQTNRFGQMPPLINGELFSWFGQFKSFALGTYNNQLKYDIGSIRDTETMLTHMVQSVVGAGVAYSRESVRATLEGRENRMKDLALWQILLIGVRNSSAYAMPLMIADSVYGGFTGNTLLSQYSTTQQAAAPMILQGGLDMVKAAPQLFSNIADPNTDVGRKQIQDIFGTYTPHYVAVPASIGVQKLFNMPDKTTKRGKSIFDLTLEADD